MIKDRPAENADQRGWREFFQLKSSHQIHSSLPSPVLSWSWCPQHWGWRCPSSPLVPPGGWCCHVGALMNCFQEKGHWSYFCGGGQWHMRILWKDLINGHDNLSIFIMIWWWYRVILMDMKRTEIETVCAATSIMGGNMTEPSPNREKDLLVLRRKSQCESINPDYSNALAKRFHNIRVNVDCWCTGSSFKGRGLNIARIANAVQSHS